MLSRGFYDAIMFWPIAAWPLIFSSCLFAIVQVCRSAQANYGASPLDSKRSGDALILYIFFPLAAIFEVSVHGYLLWMIGFKYLIMVIPIYVFGFILLPGLLDSFRTVQYVLPMVYIGFALSFVVLLGFLDVGFIRAFNSELYSVLTGYPTKL